MAAELYNDGQLTNVVALEIEPAYGYVARLTYRNGSVRMTRANDVGLNPGAACDIARDKAYTKYFLQRRGISCVRGDAFVLHWWADLIRSRVIEHGGPEPRDVGHVLPYIRTNLSLPVFIKPVDGSQGKDVWCCRDEQTILDVLAEYELQRVKVAVVEEMITMPDYRLVVLDGLLISAYERRPLRVIGDGRSTVAELLTQTQIQYKAEGRETTLEREDPRITYKLGRQGLGWASVPKSDASVPLHDISNLSAGGTAVDHTNTVAPLWRELAVDIAGQFGLRFCGIDLACADIAIGAGGYVVIEVNAAPGLDHYGSVGVAQGRIVHSLYAQVLNTAPW